MSDIFRTSSLLALSCMTVRRKNVNSSLRYDTIAHGIFRRRSKADSQLNHCSRPRRDCH